MIRFKALQNGEVIQATIDFDRGDDDDDDDDDDDYGYGYDDDDDDESGRSYDRAPIALAAMDGRLYVLDECKPRVRMLV